MAKQQGSEWAKAVHRSATAVAEVIEPHAPEKAPRATKKPQGIKATPKATKPQPQAAKAVSAPSRAPKKRVRPAATRQLNVRVTEDVWDLIYAAIDAAEAKGKSLSVTDAVTSAIKRAYGRLA